MAPDRTPDDPEIPEGCVLVARAIRPHGVDGTLRVRSYSDNPNRFIPGASLLVAGESRVIDASRELPGGQLLIRLGGIERPDVASKLAGEWLFAAIDPADAPAEGEYYHYQLAGLSVVTDQGEPLGAIVEILVTGSNDVYVVRSDTGGEILLPAITQVVKRIDLEAGTVTVHLLDGLR